MKWEAIEAVLTPSGLCPMPVGEAKWLPEIDVISRLKGDIAWVKLAINVPF